MHNRVIADMLIRDRGAVEDFFCDSVLYVSRDRLSDGYDREADARQERKVLCLGGET